MVTVESNQEEMKMKMDKVWCLEVTQDYSSPSMNQMFNTREKAQRALVDLYNEYEQDAFSDHVNFPERGTRDPEDIKWRPNGTGYFRNETTVYHCTVWDVK